MDSLCIGIAADVCQADAPIPVSRGPLNASDSSRL